MSELYYIAAGAAVALIMVVFLWRSGHFWRALFFSAVTGNAALFGVGYLGAFTGVMLTINVFTVTVATILGLPGVLTMLLIRLIFAG